MQNIDIKQLAWSVVEVDTKGRKGEKVDGYQKFLLETTKSKRMHGKPVR